MSANKFIVVILLFCALIITGCAPETPPIVLPQPTTVPIPTDIPDSPVKPDSESVWELIAYIAAEHISYHHPILVARTELEAKENLYFGIASDKRDVQQCWFYEADSNRECTAEDLDNSFRDSTVPKIFFAFAYSDSLRSLFLLEYFYPDDGQYPTDYYRLILELKDGKWVKKSILPMFW